MGRSRVAVTISIPPRLAEDYDRLARITAKNRSQLFREMFELYRQSQEEEAFEASSVTAAARPASEAVLTERDVARLVFQDR